MARDDTTGGTANGALRSIVARIERLEEDKKAVAQDLSAVYAEATGQGFEAKILRKVVRRRATDPNKLAEETALIDLYEAALEGRPPPKPPGQAGGGATPPDVDDEQPELFGEPSQPPTEAEAAAAPPEPDTPDQASDAGGQAARDGKPITANPYPPRSAQRIAWDEAWCRESGSDGMDLPEAWKPNDEEQSA